MSNIQSELLEEGDPALDPRLFRRCLGQFGTGIAIVTTSAGSRCAGVTVNSVASVSLDPPLILWSISRNSRSFPIFDEAEGFVINILAKDQIELSRHFSSSVADKFLDIAWSPGAAGPLLDGVVAQIGCQREVSHEGGDHIVLVGRVTSVRRFSGEPLLFVQGRYMVAADHPDMVVDDIPTSQNIAQPQHDVGLIPQLFETHNALSAKFEEHRQAEGLSVVPARILAALDGQLPMPLELIARRTYVGVRDTEDALAELVAKAHVARSQNGFALTNLGHERREAIRKRWLDFQSSETEGIAPTEIDVATKLMRELVSDSVTRQ